MIRDRRCRGPASSTVDVLDPSAMKALHSVDDLDGFFERLVTAGERALLLDYDGTLAPFRVERDQALPYPSVVEPLNELLRAGHTRVVIVSGRAIEHLLPLLRGIDPLPEIWGSHGWERRDGNGVLRPSSLPEHLASALEAAKRVAIAGGYAECCEIKPVGIALHWRGQHAARAHELGEKARRDWLPLVQASERQAKDIHAGAVCEQKRSPGGPGSSPETRTPTLELHEFDGGLELRASGWNKGDAVRSILDELDPDAVVAYAGDDRTDEDAFHALKGRGLSILVGEQPRETLADVWLKPPDELITFLTRWSRSCIKTQ